jgi:hypothetical protein
MKAEIEIAFLHELKGTLDALLKKPEYEVKPDLYNLAGLEGTFSMAPDASVNRGIGNEVDDKGKVVGRGFDVCDLSLPAMAVRLFVRRFTEDSTQDKTQLWARCLRDALKGDKCEYPDEAKAALKIVQDELPKGHDELLKKTEAKRTGANGVTWKIRKAKAAAKKAVTAT